MKTRQTLRRGLGVATAAVAMLVVAATPASAGANTGRSYASNNDGWANFIADGDVLHVNDTLVDGDAVWVQISWHKAENDGSDWGFRTWKSNDNGDSDTLTRYPWNIPEEATVWVRACGSVKDGTHNNSGVGYHGVVYDCGRTMEGKA